ncbi:hypothetical protein PIIN_08175 [Serendipita indica DSM 11827]|uniref:Uncharacterized protein n=1 Tax=Serendipita indica (strain DSM 11827) TaxID=1109443 RepID=G4TSC9_SERID|nr:hypothetical protein PIIN_08175 [Serendipita indica DSM 11827]
MTTNRELMRARGWCIEYDMLSHHVSRGRDLLPDGFNPLRTGLWESPIVHRLPGQSMQPAIAIAAHVQRLSILYSMEKLRAPISWNILDEVKWEWDAPLVDNLDDNDSHIDEELLPAFHTPDAETCVDTPVARRRPSASWTPHSRQEPTFIHEVSMTWDWQPFVKQPNMKQHYMAVDQRTNNSDISLLNASLRMIKATPAKIRARSEDGAIPELGEILANSIASDKVAAHWCRSSYDSPPTGAIRFCPAGRRHDSDVVLCAAEWAHKAEDVQDVVASLAEIFQPTMQRFVRQYLDTRCTPEDVMPPWMTVFGIVYNYSGLLLYAFYPYYRQAEGPPDIGIEGGHWVATADEVDLNYMDIMRRPMEDRASMPCRLFAIRQHAIEVCRRLRAEEYIKQIGDVE